MSSREDIWDAVGSGSDDRLSVLIATKASLEVNDHALFAPLKTAAKKGQSGAVQMLRCT